MDNHENVGKLSTSNNQITKQITSLIVQNSELNDRISELEGKFNTPNSFTYTQDIEERVESQAQSIKDISSSVDAIRQQLNYNNKVVDATSKYLKTVGELAESDHEFISAVKKQADATFEYTKNINRTTDNLCRITDNLGRITDNLEHIDEEQQRHIEDVEKRLADKADKADLTKTSSAPDYTADIDDLKKRMKGVETKLTNKADKADLPKTSSTSDYTADIADLKKRVKGVETTLTNKADKADLPKTGGTPNFIADFNDLKNRMKIAETNIDKKANRSDLPKSNNDSFEELEKKSRLSNYILLYCIALFNILAMPFLICNFEGISAGGLLSTGNIIVVIIAMLINMTGVALWVSAHIGWSDFAIFEFIPELVLLVFNVFTIGLFGLHPYPDTTASLKALAAFMMFANVASLALRVICQLQDCDIIFLYNDDCDKVDLGFLISQSLLLVAVLIIYCVGVRI